MAPGLYQIVHFIQILAPGQGGFAHLAAPTETAMVCHHGCPPGIVPEDPLQHGGPFIPGKVHVNVWGVNASFVQETLEEQIVGQGIYMGYAKQIRDNTGSSASSATGAGTG